MQNKAPTAQFVWGGFGLYTCINILAIAQLLTVRQGKLISQPATLNLVWEKAEFVIEIVIAVSPFLHRPKKKK